MKAIHALLACAAASAACAQAQTIYRCGDSYGSQPCAGGRELPAAPPAADAAQHRAAAGTAQRDAKLADAMEKERLKQEARPAQVYVAPAKPGPDFEPHKSPEKAATRKLDVFTASSPAPKKPKGEGKGKKGKSKAKDEGAEKQPPAAMPAGAVKRQ
ncbi:hypothetical protein [Ramlibacter humi]|uniref:DUF4124 domain-containing protein n=1 Tax=Ramlibacter humi TaxID=2530451 RepID=A0A4Z0C0F2_9BURK|nr:hypothetical protein [Ramlibacter humi]TFZ03715.1 hypothetical protein EZ216_08625 [Ramlibacter humi]